MSDSSNKCCAKTKLVLGTIGIFVIFGFLALILSGFAGHESVEDRAYMGDFTPEQIALRWANLKEVSEAQSGLVDQGKITAALEAIAQAPPKAAATTVVVPGSPTFLKQMEEAAAAAPAPAPAPAPETPAAPAPETPAAPAPETPAAPAAETPVAPAAETPAAPAPAPETPPAPAAE